MAKIYWRSIKRGTRFFADVPSAKLKSEIKALARADVNGGTISPEQYKELIGEECP